MALAKVEYAFGVGASVGEVVLVLNAHNAGGFLCALDLLLRDFRQSDMPDLPRFLKIGKCAKRLFYGHLRIDPVQLVQIDAFKAQPPQAHFYALPQILGSTDGRPLVGTLPCEARLS